ncbi:MAG: hypothetical protein LBQ11_02950 [Candidatus Nomurabacteria bacterium]|jgi:hypothetical protein|nr:hypothetical protein [Candidatus Nomurabacteria bacterium]
MKKLFLSVIAITLLLVGGLLVQTKADAVITAETPRAQIDTAPAEVTLSLAPGETYSGKFSVINTSTDTLDFYVATDKLYLEDLISETTFNYHPTYNQIIDWITFDKTHFYNLRPKEKQEVTYHIDVPKNAPGGSQYATLLAIVSKKLNNGSSYVETVDGSIGTKIYAKISGEIHANGKVQSVTQPWLYLEGLIDSTMQVENTGNIDFNSEHEYTVKSLFGRELFRGSATFRIMPGTTHKVNMEWEGTPLFGIFKVHSKMSFFDKVQYDQEKIVIVAPVWLIVIIIAILTLTIGSIFFLTLLIIKKIRHKKSRGKQKNNSRRKN